MKHNRRRKLKTTSQLKRECQPHPAKPMMEEQLAAFDALPADVRREIAKGHHMINVVAALEVWEAFGVAYAVRKVREWQRELDYQAPPGVIKVTPSESARSLATKYLCMRPRRPLR